MSPSAMELCRDSCRELAVMAGSDSKEAVEVSRVLLFIFAVTVFVILLEIFLHLLEHKCKDKPKYAEMLHKTTQELMIVGLIYLLVKFCMYAGIVKKGGVAYQAMDAADLLILFTVMSMVIQALIIFVRLKRSHHELEQVSIMRSDDLMKDAKIKMDSVSSSTWLRRELVWSRYEYLMQIKLLGQFFLHVYDLPQLFSFAKYIQEIQDTQVTHLIEIDITIWIILMGLYAGFFALTGELFDGSEYKAKEERRLAVFGGFSFLLMTSMILLLVYLKHLVQVLLKHAAKTIAINERARRLGTMRLPENLLQAMTSVIHIEEENRFQPTEEAIEKMRKVAEELTTSHDSHGSHGALSFLHHDMMFQLIGTAMRKLLGRSRKAKKHLDGPDAVMAAIALPYFSRKVIHFLIQLLLIVNGFYYALLVNCVMYVDGFSLVAAFKVSSMLVPLLVNTFVLAPKIIRQFSVINGTWRVNSQQLSSLVDSFAEVETLKKQMVMQILTHLHHHGKSVKDIEAALAAADADDMIAGDGYIEMEQVRRVLKQFGFKFTRQKFHSFVKVEFDTRGATIRYNDLLRLLQVTEEAESTRGYQFLV